jgi:hypothetical protein
MRLHGNHIAIIFIVLFISSCTAYQTFEEHKTIRTYVENGYQRTQGAHWYDNPSWKAPKPAPRSFEDKSMNLIIKERSQ